MWTNKLSHRFFQNFDSTFCVENEKNNTSQLNTKGGVQSLERQNVERPIFCNLKIANINGRIDELFDSFIFEFIFSFFRN